MKYWRITGVAFLLFMLVGVVQAQPPVPARAQGSVDLFTHQWKDADNYYLGVLLNGITPDELEVIVYPDSLMIRAQQSQEQSSDGGFASSSQSVQRSISLPRDVDIQNMQRKITGNDIVIMIPRRKK